jgi:GDPmannose 4,6-dehydratase
MWRMLQAAEPDDYVLATGVGTTVRDFTDTAFAAAGLDWRDHVEIDPDYRRPSEVDRLVGDPAKAAATLGWKASTDWRSLATIMVDCDEQAVVDQLAGRLVRIDR